MIVVSDSTPLITLMKAERLDVLQGLFGEVLIPEAVFNELTTNTDFTEEADLVKNSSFIKVVSVNDDKAVSLLRRATGLDLGESEAIVYADNNKADILLMDEVAGRRVATDMGFVIMGSIGVLIAAFKRGILSQADAKEALEKIKKANRHISSKLLQDAIEVIEGN